MEILGIGPLELIFILLIALIVLGPNDMIKAGRTIGRMMRKIVTSSEWRTIQQASKEFRYLPNRLMREAGIEELKNEFQDKNKIGGQLGLDQLKEDFDKWQQDVSSWTTPPEQISSNNKPEKKPEQKPISPDQKSNTEESETT